MANYEEKMETREPLLEQAPPVSSEPDSTAGNVDGQRVNFLRNLSGLFQQLVPSDANHEPHPSSTTPRKGALKTYNEDDLVIDRETLPSACTGTGRDYDGYISEESKRKFLADYGLSKVMTESVMSLCSTTYRITAILDNGSAMRREDSKYIKGVNKADGTKLPGDKRLARYSGYNLNLAYCPRYEALKDMSSFLTHFAATMAVPITFELISTPQNKGGKGRGFRSVGTIQKDDRSTAEDYIPLSDQVESALEMIGIFKSFIGPASTGYVKLIEEFKTFYEEERLQIEKQGGKILVSIVTSTLPSGGSSDETAEQFFNQLNYFADLPVTFVFLVETTESNILEFYDTLLSPQSGVKADVKIAKGLGLMIDGIRTYNDWLNYCLPIHLCQSLGICSNILSQAACRPLSADEVRMLCNTFVGHVPDPDEDMGAFLGAIESLMSNDEHTQWNPATNVDAPLIDTFKLKEQIYVPVKTGCCERCFGCFNK